MLIVPYVGARAVAAPFLVMTPLEAEEPATLRAETGLAAQVSEVEQRSLSHRLRNVTLTDGTNVASVPITAGVRDIVAEFDTELKLTVGASSDTAPYDGTLGSGDIVAGETVSNLRRIE